MRRLLSLFATLLMVAGTLLVAPVARADTIDTDSRKAVSDAYATWLLPALKTPPGWKGNPAKCLKEPDSDGQPTSAVGSESKASQKATFAAINYYRAMAGLRPVAENAGYSKLARQAALIMLANDDLSHTPDPDWACYSRQGAEAAGRSNIAISWGSSDGAAARSIALYMDDEGEDNAEVGHRRWLLDPSATEFGAGSTSRTNAVLVIQDRYPEDAGRPGGGTAWPSVGYFPWETMPNSRRWSYSLPDAAFDDARVAMTRNGKPLSAKVVARGDGAGDPALVWETARVKAPAPGAVDLYQVTITGATAKPIEYQVKVFRAVDARLKATPKPKISGTARVGKVLTAKAGKWKPSNVTLSYQWYRAGKKIVGATGRTYRITGRDKGRTLTVKVTGEAPGYTAKAQTSKATKKVR
jgi:uncharacterized protein YkwD